MENEKQPFSADQISDFINTGTGLTQPVLLTLLNTNDSNPLRDTLINKINNELHHRLNAKVYIGKINVPENLTTEESIRLQASFTELDINFTNDSHNTHGFAAASRRCERAVLLNRLQSNLTKHDGKIRVKEVGGDIVRSVINGEKSIHCCSPLLSSYDATRFSNRLYNAYNVLDSGIIRDSYSKEILSMFVNSSNHYSGNDFFCFNTSQECSIKAKSLLFLHSTYDMSLTDIANSMERADAIVAYGSFVYSSKILTDDTGTIEWINAQYVIKRHPITNRRERIVFGFKNDSGFSYEHNYKNYMSLLTKSQFSSDNKNYYSIELLENRNGIQFFRINRLPFYYNKPTSHRLYLSHLSNKYIVRFPYFSYKPKDRTYSFPVKGNKVTSGIKANNDFWYNLPRNVEWIYLTVEAEVVDKTCAYVLGATEEKFKPEHIITYLRSITTRETMYTTVTKRNELPPINSLAALAHAIYITLYQTKYVYGKALQQAKLNVNALRVNRNPDYVLGEFDRRHNYFTMLVDFLLRRKRSRFDPRKFITVPSEYVEYRTTAIGDSCIINSDFHFGFDTTDILVSEELLNDQLAYPSNPTPVKVKTVFPLAKEKLSILQRVSKFVRRNDKKNAITSNVVSNGYSPNIIINENFKPPPKPKRLKRRAPLPPVNTPQAVGSIDENPPVNAPQVAGNVDEIKSEVESQPTEVIYAEVKKPTAKISTAPVQEVKFTESENLIYSVLDLPPTPPVRPPRSKKLKEPDLSDIVEEVENDYPRLGILTSNGEIDVDGSKNECCFIAMTEDRAADISLIRNLITINAKPEVGSDLYEELKEGNFAGTAVIQAFANIYNFSYIINYDSVSPNFVIKPVSSSIPIIRTINLVYRNSHYYIKPTCKRVAKLSYRRDEMIEPINWVTTSTAISSVINVFDSTYEKLKNEKKPGCYLVNNLSTYCNLHNECKNNNLLKFVELLYTSNVTNISICMLFEKKNFSVDHLENIRRQHPDLGFRYVDANLNGYFAAVIHKLPNVEQLNAKLAHKTFVNHTCDNSNNILVDTENNIVYRCKPDEGSVVDKYYNHADLYVEVKKRDIEDSGKPTIIYQTPNRLIMYGTGNKTGKLSNSTEIAKIVASHLKHHTPTVLFSVMFVSDFSDVSRIVNLMKVKCRFIFLKTEVYRSFHTDLTVNYLPDVTTLDRRKNAMLECYQIWFYERSTVVNQLSSGYQAMTNAVSQGLQLLSNIDNSMCLFDLQNKTFVRGNSPSPPYNWGFSTIGLFNTAELFTKHGDVAPATANKFIKNGLRYIAFNSASKLMHGITLTDSYEPESIHNLRETPITYIQGVPGAGKTQYILESNKGKTRNLILTVTKEAKDDMIRRATAMQLILSTDRIRTLDSVLVNNNAPTDTDEVWLDEAFLVHPGNWCWISHITTCNHLFVVGDDAQIPYINRSGLSISRSKPTEWLMTKSVLSVDHRNPLDIVYWLNSSKFYSFNVTGSSQIENSVSSLFIYGPDDIPIEKGAKYLTFTQTEKNTLSQKGFDVNTIHEYQGSQNGVIYLVRLISKDTNSIYESIPHILVALTRHSKKLVYCTAKLNDKTDKYIKLMQTYTKINFSSVKQRLLAGAERVIKPDSSTVLYTENRDTRRVLMNSLETGYISTSFYITNEFQEQTEPSVVQTLNFDYRLLQDFVDRTFPGSSTAFREFDHDMFEYYYNRCNFTDVSYSLSLPSFKKYDRLFSNLRTSIQYPLHQSQKISMKAFFERNGQVPQLQGLIDSASEAQRLLMDFKKLCPHSRNFQSEQIFPDIQNTSEWLRTQPPSVVAMVDAEGLFLDLNLSIYDFIIKTIPKIDLEAGAEFRYKSPQTIAFQKKGINAVFCPILKEMMNRVEFSLNENIVLYNRMSPQQFAQKFSEAFPPTRYNELNTFLEIDFSKYDKSQGLVILMFEALLMEWLGVPPKYIRMWIVMHRLTFIYDRNNKFSAVVEYQRKSGDAGTWRFNTIVQMAVLNRVYKLHALLISDQAFACFSGDDSLIFLKNPIPNLEAKTFKLECIYNLEAKILNYAVPYFCSKFLLLVDNEWIFVPDTLKLIIKLGRNDLTDFDHVECYRISFDDNLYYYKFPNFWYYISQAINDRYKLVGEHDCVYMALLRLASNKENFSSLYYENIGHIHGILSSKPSIEI
uniref:Replicase large subunit n=1 Tax=Ceratitis capitata TaxID=7213 RepID=W8BUH7_CERCA